MASTQSRTELTIEVFSEAFMKEVYHQLDMKYLSTYKVYIDRAGDQYKDFIKRETSLMIQNMLKPELRVAHV